MSAVCINTDGGYMCACLDGYTGNGFLCKSEWNLIAISFEL